jgi:hypothetical protein
MSDLAWILVIIGVIAVCVSIVRLIGAFVSWRLVLAVLAVAILASAGLLNVDPILNEVDHAITNLFGTPAERN